MSSTAPAAMPLPQKGASCQQLLAERTVAHYGTLRKRSTVNKLTDSVVKKVISSPQQFMQWPKRFVVLLNGCLYVFKDETSNKACCAVSLYGYKSVLPCTTEVQTKLPWPFRLVNALNDKQLTLYFSAPTERDMKTWIQHMEQQLIYANGFNAAEFLASRGAGPPPVQQQSSLGRSEEPSSRASSSSGEMSYSAADLDPQLIYVNEDEDEFADYDVIEELEIVRPMEAAKLFCPRPTGSKNSATDVDSYGYVQPEPQHSKPVAELRPTKQSKPVVLPKSTPQSKSTPPISKPNAVVRPNVSSSSGGGTGWPRKPEDNQCEKPEEAEYVCGEEYQDVDMGQYRQTKEPGLQSARWVGGAKEADEKMKTIRVLGAYMIRASQEPGCQTLVVKGETIVRKYKIQRSPKDGRYSLLSSDPGFKTLTELIEYYKSHAPPHQNIPLTVPYTAA